MLRTVRRFRPDVIVGRYCISGGLAGKLTGCPVIVFDDTEHAELQRRLSLPLADLVCVTTSFTHPTGPRHLRYDSLDQLAYVHPRYFLPDPKARDLAGLEPKEPFSIVRLVAWQALHDRGVERIGRGGLDALTGTLQPYGKVLISSETNLEKPWSQMQVKAPPEIMLSLLAEARIYVGEGASMAAEAACLGTPAVYVNPLRVGYLQELQNRYGLVCCTSSVGEAIRAATKMLSQDRSTMTQRLHRLLEEKQDATGFVVDLVETVGRGGHRAIRQELKRYHALAH